MILDPNYRLKAEIIARYGTITNGARAFQIDIFRLSRLIHGRGIPTSEEKNTISSNLNNSIEMLFGR